MTDLFILPFLNIEFRRMITILLFPPSRFNNYQHITILKFFSIYIHTYILFFFIVVRVQLSPFSSCHSPLPHPTPPPTRDPTPFDFVHVSFTHVPGWPFPLFHPLSPSCLLSGYCQFILYSNVPESTYVHWVTSWHFNNSSINIKTFKEYFLHNQNAIIILKKINNNFIRSYFNNF